MCRALLWCHSAAATTTQKAMQMTERVQNSYPAEDGFLVSGGVPGKLESSHK
jgi:hypothetical protein